RVPEADVAGADERVVAGEHAQRLRRQPVLMHDDGAIALLPEALEDALDAGRVRVHEPGEAVRLDLFGLSDGDVERLELGAEQRRAARAHEPAYERGRGAILRRRYRKLKTVEAGEDHQGRQ